MIRVTALYPKTAESTFDLDYYLNKHTPLVSERLTPHGLTRIEVDEALGSLTPGQPADYAVIGYLFFASLEGLQSGLAAHAPELIADIANFTNVQPKIQINKIILS
jgi:uncharacterized protein (TIGR02118 family)